MLEADVFPPGQIALAAESTTVSRPVCAHSHDFAEFAFVRSGRAEQHTEQGVTALREGSLVVLAPGSWHATEPEGDLAITNVYLSSSLLACELAWLADLPRIGPLLHPGVGRHGSASAMTLELDPAIHRRTEEPLERFVEANGQSLFSRLARFFDLLAVLAPALENDELGRNADVRPPPHHRRSTTASHLVTHYRHGVAHAISLLHDRIDEHWTLTALAREASLSPSQFARVFRADTGTSPMAYLQRIRAERLAYLLRTTDTTIAAAAHAVGWHDPGYATRRFRAHWNTTPRAYRNRIR
ncbi:AraC family transcriptional regulator [Streptomyces sp. NPDC001455]|uniref:AraC family transcriptional regulator n=1 Tax=unclassified Streptomyces TaxID=2593676 RepID=UPI003323C9AA